MVKILNQILRRLDTNRDPDQAVGDTEPLPIFRGHASVRRSGWPRHQRFHTTKTGCNGREGCFLKKVLGRSDAPLQLKAQHATEPIE